MTKALALAALTAVFAAAGTDPAFAQSTAGERPLFVDLSGGIAAKPAALTTGTTFTVFGETGSAATQSEAGTSALFDLRVGYRVRPRLGVAGALSGSQSDVAGTTIASVPSPIRFASPSIVSLAAPDAKRREIGVHLQAVYALPVTEKVTLTIAGGPSLVHLRQGVQAVSVAGVTPTAVPVNEAGTGLGGNVGVDLTSLFSAHYGVGVLVRYVAANVDLPSASGVKTGGVQAGVGLRMRF
jgi:outer membrane protein with beta-barrel domain